MSTTLVTRIRAALAHRDGTFWLLIATMWIVGVTVGAVLFT